MMKITDQPDSRGLFPNSVNQSLRSFKESFHFSVISVLRVDSSSNDYS